MLFVHLNIWECGAGFEQDSFFVPCEDEEGTYKSLVPHFPTIAIGWGARLASRILLQKIESQ